MSYLITRKQGKCYIRPAELWIKGKFTAWQKHGPTAHAPVLPFLGVTESGKEIRVIATLGTGLNISSYAADVFKKTKEKGVLLVLRYVCPRTSNQIVLNQQHDKK